MLKVAIPMDNSSSKCNSDTFSSNASLAQRLGAFHVIGKGGSVGILKGACGLGKPFFFPFPLLPEARVRDSPSFGRLQAEAVLCGQCFRT